MARGVKDYPKVEVQLDVCGDSPTNYHHFILPLPNGDKTPVGVCKYCGDNKVHQMFDVGYNNRPISNADDPHVNRFPFTLRGSRRSNYETSDE